MYLCTYSPLWGFVRHSCERLTYAEAAACAATINARESHLAAWIAAQPPQLGETVVTDEFPTTGLSFIRQPAAELRGRDAFRWN